MWAVRFFPSVVKFLENETAERADSRAVNRIAVFIDDVSQFAFRCFFLCYHKLHYLRCYNVLAKNGNKSLISFVAL